MRRVFKSSSVVFTAACVLFVGSVPAMAQSGSRNAPPSGSSGRSAPPEGSGRRAQEQAPLALGGHCAVSIVDMHKWVKGDAAHRVVYDGQTYLFANAQAKKMFEANPAKYVPALGGNCVVALVKKGKRVPGNIRHATIHDGRLFLFSNAEAKKMFLAEPATYANADLALGGNCPVCAAGGHKTPGKPEIAAFHKGLRYLFPSAGMRDAFLANPEKYISAEGSGTRTDEGSSTRQPSSGSGTRPPAGSGSGTR